MFAPCDGALQEALALAPDARVQLVERLRVAAGQLAVAEVEGLYDPVWDHFTAEGHRLAAGRIDEWLQQAGSADAVD